MGYGHRVYWPISIQATAQFPKSGFWDVHGDFMVKAEYANGITMYTSGGYTNGIRYEGSEGWIFVSRGNYVATASDPVAKENSSKALDASDPKILNSEIGKDESIFILVRNNTVTCSTASRVESNQYLR